MIEKGDYIDKAEAKEGIEIPDHLGIKRVNSTGSSDSNKRGVYHTEYCNKWPDKGRAMSKETAEAWGYRECRMCSGEYNPANADFSYQEALKEAAKNE